MNIMDCIITRRSIRKYTGQVITEEQLEALLKAAMYAPSAMKRLPWHFVVIQDPEKLAKITEIHPYTKMVVAAGTAIVVCGDASINDNITHLTQDTAAAIENILLAAHGMGLGTCWCGLYDNVERRAAICELCGIEDENILPMSIIAVGNPDDAPETPDRFKPERIHREKW